MSFIDSHCHIDFACFDRDREQVINRCHGLGINTLVAPGTRASQWQHQLLCAEAFPQIKVAFGLHPYFLAEYQPRHMNLLSELLQVHRKRVVAVGEMGLDKHIDISWSLQMQVFEQQLEMASNMSLPVIVHHRKSHNHIIQCLKQYKFQQGGIIHAFTGSLQQALSYIDMGFKLGVGGSITYQRANKTRQTFSQVPLSSLVLETDAPDMPLMGQQGQRNSPEYIPQIFDALMELREETPAQVMQACVDNAEAVLRNM